MTDGDAPLRLGELPPPIIEPLREAQVVAVRGEGFANGVFRADGSFCELSRTRISDSRFTDRAARPLVQPAERLAGSYLFAGLGRHHFGHFLMETASRLWALDGREAQFDGLILLPMPGIDFAAVLRRRLQVFFDLMGCGLPIHLVQRDLMVERLHVPAQGFGHLQWSAATLPFRRFVRDRIEGACRPEGPEKIYISRSRLKHAFQHVDQEARIEALMRAAGYTVFHPEQHDMMVQCQTYRAARVIVGGDGSAFHLVPFAMRPDTRVGLIQRRLRRAPVDAIANQIEAFARVDLVRLDPLCRGEDGALLPSVGRKQTQPLDFERLRAQLEAAALI